MAVINETTQKMLEERYFYKKPTTGELMEKTATDMFRRVAKTVAEAEPKDKKHWEDTFFNLMNCQLSMPNTPTLIGAGYEGKCLSACSVIGRIPDSMEGIYDYMYKNATLTKSGLGVGQDLSAIRPKGEIIKSSGGVSAGVVNWMTLINSVAETTKQGDKARRAANMVGLRFNHPDILDFIRSKRDNTNFSNMNISVVISDAEMSKVENDEDIDLVWNGKKYRTVRARDIFNEIIENMYHHGDPGVLFLDTMNKNNPFNLHDGKFSESDSHYIVITNPCGEQNLEQFEYCNLMSIDVSKLYNAKTNSVNWGTFEQIIKDSIRFLDDVIDVNSFPVKEFEPKVKGNRKIGLGVTGYADLLVKLGIKYDSDEHIDFINRFFSFKQKQEILASHELALEKGNAPNWEKSIWGQKKYEMRNLCRNTQAPTGSVSTILGTSAYGIEPYFMVCYKRRIMDSEIYEANDLFKKMLHSEVNDTHKEQEIMKECYEQGTVQLQTVPQKLRDLFRCANDISADWHIKVQAEIQKHIDSAVSKTINAPENDTIDNLDKRVISAWKQGVVGMTYYRNNSLDNQTIQIGEKTKTEETKNHLDSISPITRSNLGNSLGGTTYSKRVACGKVYITLNHDEDNNIVEVFVSTGKSGGCAANAECLGRLSSLACRSGIKIDELIDSIKGVKCAACSNMRGKNKQIDGISCGDMLARTIQEEYDRLKSADRSEIRVTVNPTVKEEIGKCPDCGAPLFRTEGCVRCSECGYSKC